MLKQLLNGKSIKLEKNEESATIDQLVRDMNRKDLEEAVIDFIYR